MPPPCRLYLITPPALDDLDALAGRLSQALEGGDVGALQVRLKTASDAEIAEVVRRLGVICRARDVPLILNDRPDLAARLDCDGVHIGQSDMALDEARRAVGRDRIVGVTCHDSRHLAMEAAEGGADYVAFGAFFPTSTKETTARPDLEILEIWQETMVIPCVAIGGVTPENCEPSGRRGRGLPGGAPPAGLDVIRTAPRAAVRAPTPSTAPSPADWPPAPSLELAPTFP